MNLKENRKLLAIIAPACLGWLYCLAAFYFFKEFGVTLFFLVPVTLGVLSTFLVGFRTDVTFWNAYKVSLLALVLFLVGLVLFAIEGIICAIMALPFAGVGVLLGTAIGFAITDSKFLNKRPQTLAVFILIIPALMSFESNFINNSEVFSVTTSIEINSPPEKVWKNVIEFPQLEEPKELLFKSGIAYPINAVINGTGVGAIRHCNFSTGSFVEPITVWNEPSLLKFSVEEQPEVMKELSPYDIHPDHLHGYFVSKEGQFKLTKLENGNTLLEGTTWYTNRVKPDFYWTLWSDYIVHKIHKRVLEHIKKQSEK